MEQHPVPQQISSYQFRLVGDMTLKQFFELAGGALVGLLFYTTTIPVFIKWPLIIASVLFGVALAFLPFEDRPLEIWVVAFFRSIYSPTHYFWQKTTVKPKYFQDEESGVTPNLGIIAPKGEAAVEKYLTEKPGQNTSLFKKLEEFERGYLSKITGLFTSKPTSTQVPAQVQSVQTQYSVPPVQTQAQIPQPQAQIQPQPVQPQMPVQPPIQLQPKVQVVTPIAEEQKVVVPVQPPTIVTQPEPEPIKVTPLQTITPIVRSVPTPLPAQTITPIPIPQPIPTPSPVVLPQPVATTPMPIPTPAPEPQFTASPPMPPTQPNTISGQVMDASGRIIDSAILEIKDEAHRPVRAVKTNKLGHFFIVTPLSNGQYEILTEKEGYDFSPMRFLADGNLIQPISIRAKKAI